MPSTQTAVHSFTRFHTFQIVSTATKLVLVKLKLSYVSCITFGAIEFLKQLTVRAAFICAAAYLCWGCPDERFGGLAMSRLWLDVREACRGRSTALARSPTLAALCLLPPLRVCMQSHLLVSQCSYSAAVDKPSYMYAMLLLENTSQHQRHHHTRGDVSAQEINGVL